MKFISLTSPLIIALLALASTAGWCQNLPPEMPLPPMKKDERAATAPKEAAVERKKREAAETEAADLKRQLAETKKQAAQTLRVIKSDSHIALEQLAYEITKTADFSLEVVIVVAGANRIGSNQDNQALSEDRARVVKDFLVARNIPANRIYTEAKGNRNGEDFVDVEVIGKKRGEKLAVKRVVYFQ